MKTDRFKYVVASTILLAFIIVVHALTYKNIPESSKDVFIHTIGILEGALMMIVSFYFGTSSSSAAKNEIINNQINKTQQ